jgi:hypothetical protein
MSSVLQHTCLILYENTLPWRRKGTLTTRKRTRMNTEPIRVYPRYNPRFPRSIIQVHHLINAIHPIGYLTDSMSKYFTLEKEWRADNAETDADERRTYPRVSAV